MSIHKHHSQKSSNTSTAHSLDNNTSSVGSYVICEKIGQGSFATVYKAKHKITGHLVAIKSVLRSKLTKKLLENLESEISILKAIRHDHIVGLSECQKTDTHIHLVMDYCTMGDLSQYIKRIRSTKATRGSLGGLPEDTVRHFLQQLASALRFLRSQNLVHRDIKPQNLLLVAPSHESSALPTLQVADFGFARFLPNASLADTLCGSPLYMGPEILSYKKYDAKTDLWSVGAVLYEMMTGRPPFRAQNHLELLKRIQENNDVIRFADEKVPDMPSMMGDDLKDLVRKLLKKDPVERISFEEFFVHPAILRSANPMPIPSSANTKPDTASTHSSYPRRTPSTPDTPPRHIAKQQDDNHHITTTTTDPPPFAQSTSHSHRRMSTALSSSPGRQALYSRNQRDNNPSPSHSRGRSAKTVEFKDNSHNDLHESGAPIKRTNRRDEEVLQDYVFLDRRTIATNQFADEVNASPHNDEGDRYPIRGAIGQVAIPRRKSSTSSLSTATTASSDQTGYMPSSTSPNTPPFVMSRERRISSGGGVAAGSALAKALSMAGERLFGTGKSPPNSSNRPQRTGTPRAFLTLMMNGQQGIDDDVQTTADDHDNGDIMIDTIEKMACMGHAVARFADTKYELLIHSRGGSNDTILAAEALVLHLKALSLLELGFDMAKKYWHRKKVVDSHSPASRYSAIRLNDAVQWMRERFNDCLDRASFEKSRCDRLDTSNDSSSGNNNDNPCVEKLLYDRALEMSRAAAVNELVGENIPEVRTCEQDYQTAIWMLEAIMEVGDDKDEAIEEDDRNIINKFIDSIQQRLSILRKKIMNQKERQQHHYQGPTTTTTSTPSTHSTGPTPTPLADGRKIGPPLVLTGMSSTVIESKSLHERGFKRRRCSTISIQTSIQHIPPGNAPRPLILPLKQPAGAQF
ncbi:hypothetical protein [Absidia glauca]|uniref:non-specific serine/threonine protein kinase n=1 Tax=Absidia glauca TaxID=4829 RepID=A0A170APP6_ABSGL|nr:hypothetical protein [Absidia glauca]